MTTTVTAALAASPDVPPARQLPRPEQLLLLAALAVLVVAAVVGVTSGPLWLDETISVEIAHRPLPDLFAALRRDGSPPLYYLLLHAWTALVGTSTAAVRLLSVLLVPVLASLVGLLGRRLRGPAAGRSAVVALAALPWTLRYLSETRMYLLVAVLVAAGSLALLSVRQATSWAASWRPVVGLGLCTAALLYTHYWSLFLLVAVAGWHVPGVLRRRPEALRVAAGMALGGVLFLPQVPTFLFQAAHTGAPWAKPSTIGDLLSTPSWWGAGNPWQRWIFALLLVPLVVVGARRVLVARAALGVTVAALLVAWTSVQVSGGAYVVRYTAIVVPLIALAAGIGATTLPGRWPVAALAVLLAVGAVTGVPSAARLRTPAERVATAFLAQATPGDVLLYCPDQLGPPTARLLGDGYRQVVYPTLAAPDLVDWVDYAQRNEAASPDDVAQRVSALAAGHALFVEKASDYETFSHDDVDDCNQLLRDLTAERGVPARLYGKANGKGETLYRFAG